MRFDDRLLTVLNQPAEDRHDAAVRWRQLVDLVARAGSNSASPVVAEALEAIRREAPNVDEGLRAAAARAVAALPLPLGLLEYLATDTLSVSAPVLAAATLDHHQWTVLHAAADEETRAFIETLHPELKAEARVEAAPALVAAEVGPPDHFAAPPPPPEAPSEPLSTSPSLHDVVERIERRRRLRSGATAPPAAAVPGPGASALFRWECGPGGEIAWVEGAPRGALIGRTIARSLDGDGDQVDQEVVRAFALRAPFRDALFTVSGSGAVAGEWKISGVPAFEPADGRFAGYRGIALRELDESDHPEEAAALLSDPDSLRELVHEIKTPLNAIIGFAEIIEGQYLGPADQPYRERAHDIVRQARLLVTAIDDLDFAAKVHSSAAGEQRRVNVGELAERMTPALRELALGRKVELDASRTTRDTTAASEPELADRLVFRMCSAVIEQAEPGERLRLTVESAGGQVRVSMTRPVSLRGLSEEQLLGCQADLDHGFKFRLVRGLARLAGADLMAPEGIVSLLFPRG